MLTLHLAPRRGSVPRAAWATVEITGVLVLGHAWAGGALPSPVWIALMALAVFGAGVLVLRDRIRVRYALPGLVAAQLLLHGWLVALEPAASVAGHSGHHEHAALALPMIGVHLAAALLTALVWEVRARATDVIVTWSRSVRLPVVTVRRSASVPIVEALLHRYVVADAPRRGPPTLLAPAPA
ncbi:MAG: hypothetical protein WB767_18175 [Nocardioides sp.]